VIKAERNIAQDLFVGGGNDLPNLVHGVNDE
jgi:hypothetical protein